MFVEIFFEFLFSTKAEYKKFKTHAEAQNYLDDDVKIVKITTKKTKISRKVSESLVKETIENLQSTLLISQSDKKVVSSSSDEFRVVYSDGCCFGNGQNGSRAGFGVFWDDNHPW